MSSVTFAYWGAYSRLHPFGTRRDNLHAGIIASTLINVNQRRGATPTTPSDFLLVDPKTKQQSKQDEFIAFLDAVAIPKEKTWQI